MVIGELAWVAWLGRRWSKPGSWAKWPPAP